MQENQYKIIFCDFDGTLVGADFKVLPEVAKQIQRWNDSGRFFSIATGKLFPGVIEEVCQELRLSIPQIIAQGAAVIDPTTQKILYAKYVPDEKARVLIDVLKNTPVLFEIDTFDGTFASSEKLVNEEKHKKYLSLEEFNNQKILKIRLVTTHNTDEEITKVKQTLAPLIAGLLLVPSDTPYSTGFDIIDEGATKHEAVEFVTHFLNGTKDQTIGIGNGINDTELLSACGYKVATQDAPEALKKIADRIIPTYSEGGVGILMKDFI
jgi:Cof subfamily protein (haloacid dehalogenase superfamily)